MKNSDFADVCQSAPESGRGDSFQPHGDSTMRREDPRGIDVMIAAEAAALREALAAMREKRRAAAARRTPGRRRGRPPSPYGPAGVSWVWLRRAWRGDAAELRSVRAFVGPRRLLRALAVPWAHLDRASPLAEPSPRVLSRRAERAPAPSTRRGLWGALERWAASR